MAGQVIWLNGAFGSGKTSTAAELASLRPGLRIFDPEEVGFMLRANLQDQPVDDFQRWPAWPRLVAATSRELIEHTGQSLIAPQTVLSKLCWAEINHLLDDAEIRVTHVLLDCDSTVLTERVRASDEATAWRLEHIEPYLAARDEWMMTAADVVVDTTATSPEGAARAIDDVL